MIQIIHSKDYHARKMYIDNGWEDIQNSYYIFTLLEKSRIDELIKPWLIHPGDIYNRQFNADSGDTWVYRTKKLFIDLIQKYNIDAN